MEVELDVFSGRPNPRWQLSPEQARDFLRNLKSLVPAAASWPYAEKLGYRGLIVRPNGDLFNGFEEVRLYRGTVVAKRAAHVEGFSDPQRTLELQFLQTARGKVEESILRYIETELGH
ncbi:MAG: hypothetical protein CV088_16070 [Nitrospira sp. LK70]|nr:hypothetical protein [Nitrospira sp. LK70]